MRTNKTIYNTLDKALNFMKESFTVISICTLIAILVIIGVIAITIFGIPLGLLCIILWLLQEFFYFMIRASKRIYKNLDEEFNITKKLSHYWLHLLIFIGVLIIFGLCFALEINYNKASSLIDLNFWLDNLLPNVLADMIGIIFTTFIIAGLFSRNNRIAEEKRLYKIVGLEFEKSINILCRNYLYILRRDTKYMGFQIRDEEIKEEIETLAQQQSASINFSTLIKTFDVMDISDISGENYIYESFVVLVPKLQNHLELMDLHSKKLRKLAFSSELELYYLENFKENFGKHSFQYKKKLTEYNQLKLELETSRCVLTPIKKEHLQIEIVDVFYKLSELVKTEADKLSAKYNTILPLDVRLIFSELEKTIYSIGLNIHKNKNADKYFGTMQEDEDIFSFIPNREQEALDLIPIVAKKLLELENYFNNTKRLI